MTIRKTEKHRPTYYCDGVQEANVTATDFTNLLFVFFKYFPGELPPEISYNGRKNIYGLDLYYIRHICW